MSKNKNNQGLQPGSTYYTISMDAERLLGLAFKANMKGQNTVKLAAFPNKNKQKGDNKPVLRIQDGRGVIWKNKVQSKPQSQGQQEKDMSDIGAAIEN